MARVWLTRRSASPSGNFSFNVSWNVASRVSLTRRAIRSIAQSSVLDLSHSAAPGARYQTCVTRLGSPPADRSRRLWAQCPAVQRLSGFPSMLTILRSFTETSWLQPTAQ